MNAMNNTDLPLLKARLVVGAGDCDWILGKFAVRLQENLGAWGVVADIDDSPSDCADINHWIFYAHPWWVAEEMQRKKSPTTVTITHIDDPIKLRILKDVLAKSADCGICLSRMCVDDLVQRGIPRAQLCYITPAHDNAVRPQRLVIGITSRVYSDGRKRESLLVKLSQAMRLDLFHFEILGSGWEPTIEHLERAGATVRYSPGTDNYRNDYAVLLERLQTFDYYLYMGLEGGSMGLFDALAAGIQTIVTREGFHLDIEGGITHGFWDGQEMIDIFRQIARDRQRRIDSVKDLTWNEYARRHALVWRAMLAGKQAQVSDLLNPTGSVFDPPKRSFLSRMKTEIGFWLNARTSVFRRSYFGMQKGRIRMFLSRIKSRLKKVCSRS